ncbi:hypothetical protein V5O48_004677 [Marasmius crinis-equi]|uniref:DUF1168-domain-containing protein n=1 Tax=Marasmius crinis-equi TaxID=585013 RepID=A0ABR3FPJ5_9AGAR
MGTPDPDKDASASRPANRHVLTAVEKQRAQLDRLLKDPSKVAYVPPPPKEKSIRAAREMMKNVQGSSAGAGSGEFHVYKASRRREYERLNLLEEQSRKLVFAIPPLTDLQETETAEFERRRKEAEENAEAKTAKNRAKRQKKKDRSKAAKSESKTGEGGTSEVGNGSANEAPLKKRRLVNGRELIFKRQDGEDEEEQDEDNGPQLEPTSPSNNDTLRSQESLAAVVETSRVVIHDD